jgi:hypothetical protein
MFGKLELYWVGINVVSDGRLFVVMSRGSLVQGTAKKRQSSEPKTLVPD